MGGPPRRNRDRRIRGETHAPTHRTSHNPAPTRSCSGHRSRVCRPSGPRGHALRGGTAGRRARGRARRFRHDRRRRCHRCRLGRALRAPPAPEARARGERDQSCPRGEDQLGAARRGAIRPDDPRGREEGTDRARRDRWSGPRPRRRPASGGLVQGTACYAALLRSFGRNLDATADAVRTLRSPRQAILRAITLPDVVPGAKDVVPPFITPTIGKYQDTTLKRYICSAMTEHGGRCVDAYRAFNGPAGTENAYTKGWLTKNPCCYPSGKGQQVMAQLVLESGLAPLR